MNTRVIPAIGIILARRCKPVLLAQLYYAERELLFCCGILNAFLGFFVSEGLFDSFPLEHFAVLKAQFFVEKSLKILPNLLNCCQFLLN